MDAMEDIRTPEETQRTVFKVRPCEGIGVNNGEFAVGKARKRAIKAAADTANDLAPWVIVKLRCSGKFHEVAWHERGRITLLDHSHKDVRGLRVMQKLGDTTCGCLALMDKLKAAMAYGNTVGLPSSLKPLVRANYRAKGERKFHGPRFIAPPALPAGFRWNNLKPEEKDKGNYDTDRLPYFEWLRHSWRQVIDRSTKLAAAYASTVPFGIVGASVHVDTITVKPEQQPEFAHASWEPIFQDGRVIGVRSRISVGVRPTARRVLSNQMHCAITRAGHFAMTLAVLSSPREEDGVQVAKFRVAEPSQANRPKSVAEATGFFYVRDMEVVRDPASMYWAERMEGVTK